MNHDQSADSQENSPNVHRAFCELILEAGEAEVDAVIRAFNRDPQQLSDEAKRTIEAALAASEAKIIPFGSYSPPDHVVEGQPDQGFGRLMQMLRRRENLKIEELSKKADISVNEIHLIEESPGYLPKPRTLFQLERFFKLPTDSLARFSGVIIKKDREHEAERFRFAACSNGMGKLTKDEKDLLAQFVKHLSELS